MTNSFVYSMVCPGELYAIIGTLKKWSSPGLDGISNTIVKSTACFIVDVLCFIFNLSVSTGIFPLFLKQAIVVPIWKRNDKACLNNYRPISLLSVFSKIFEKAMKTRIFDFLNMHNFLYPMQYGFRQNKNTEQAALYFLEKVGVSIDQGLKTSALFIDLTKAFDRVDHTTLLMKLYCCGFRGDIHNWFCSYLRGRTQVVRVGRQLSGELPISVGVPQGSVLGPLLFLIYINGIFMQPLCGSPTAFADDFSFSYGGIDSLVNSANIIHDLKILSVWLKVHNMLLSDKTKIMHFKDAQISLPPVDYHEFGCNKASCVSKNCFTIKLVDEFRYLGIYIDCNLNWKPHIERLKSKLLLVSRKLYKLRLYCSHALLRMVYFALVDSVLQYGLSCWGGACKTALKVLEIRQKHIIRLMCFMAVRSPSWPVFLQLEILPLRHMFVFKVLRLFYNMSGNTFVNYAEYNLRTNSLFKKQIPPFRLDLRRSFFLVVAPILFNNLPCDIRMSSSFSVFSLSLRKWLYVNKDIDKLFRLSN